MSGSTEPELYETAEVALKFRVRPRTILNWTRKGKLGTAVVQIGREPRFRRAEIERLLRGEQLGSDGV
jgi:predicted site-specific integrase-resolvase